MAALTPEATAVNEEVETDCQVYCPCAFREMVHGLMPSSKSTSLLGSWAVDSQKTLQAVRSLQSTLSREKGLTSHKGRPVSFHSQYAEALDAAQVTSALRSEFSYGWIDEPDDGLASVLKRRPGEAPNLSLQHVQDGS